MSKQIKHEIFENQLEAIIFIAIKSNEGVSQFVVLELEPLRGSFKNFRRAPPSFLYGTPPPPPAAPHTIILAARKP